MKRGTIVIALTALSASALILFGGSGDSGTEEWTEISDRVALSVNEGNADAGAGAGSAEGKEKEANESKETEAVESKEKETAEEQAISQNTSSANTHVTSEDSSKTAPEGTIEENMTSSLPTKIEGNSGGNVQGEPAVIQAVQDTEPADDAVVSGEASSAAEGKVAVNTATLAELMELPGIGETKAQAIMDYRAEHGPFQKPSDLTNVKGIGVKMLEKMSPYLYIN